MYELYDVNEKLVYSGRKRNVLDKLLDLSNDDYYELRRVSDGEMVASGSPAEIMCAID